jgi:hypothetical protein
MDLPVRSFKDVAQLPPQRTLFNGKYSDHRCNAGLPSVDRARTPLSTPICLFSHA